MNSHRLEEGGTWCPLVSTSLDDKSGVPSGVLPLEEYTNLASACLTQDMVISMEYTNAAKLGIQQVESNKSLGKKNPAIQQYKSYQNTMKMLKWFAFEYTTTT